MTIEALKRRQISKEDRIKAVLLNKQGKSYSQIGIELNRTKSCVKTIIDRYKQTKSYDDRPRSGRPKISTVHDDRQLVRLVKKNRTSPSHVLAHDWKLSNGKKASASLVRRRLLANKLEWKYAVRKPRLSKAHKKARRDFCLKVKSWSKVKWRQIIFSDEMNIEVDNRKNRIRIRRMASEKYNEECIFKRTKQGSGSIGIWCCMSYYGLGIFTLFDGRLNANRYIDILGNNLIPSIDLFHKDEPFIFQQDNAPCHRARLVTQWFQDQEIDVLSWPANSPDLNCIENLWSWLDKEIAKQEPRTLDELKKIVPNILNNIPKSILENLVDSMPNRINDCLKNKGGSTRY